MGGDITDTTYGYFDTWIIKTDASGNKLWDRTYGGSGSKTDGLVSMKQTSDGGYLMWIVSGGGINNIKTDSSRGSSDYWIVKINYHNIINNLSNHIRAFFNNIISLF